MAFLTVMAVSLAAFGAARLTSGAGSEAAESSPSAKDARVDLAGPGWRGHVTRAVKVGDLLVRFDPEDAYPATLELTDRRTGEQVGYFELGGHPWAAVRAEANQVLVSHLGPGELNVELAGPRLLVIETFPEVRLVREMELPDRSTTKTHARGMVVSADQDVLFVSVRYNHCPSGGLGAACDEHAIRVIDLDSLVTAGEASFPEYCRPPTLRRFGDGVLATCPANGMLFLVDAQGRGEVMARLGGCPTPSGRRKIAIPIFGGLDGDANWYAGCSYGEILTGEGTQHDLEILACCIDWTQVYVLAEGRLALGVANRETAGLFEIVIFDERERRVVQRLDPGEGATSFAPVGDGEFAIAFSDGRLVVRNLASGAEASYQREGAGKVVLTQD